MLLRKKAQSTAEYAITIGIVVAVVAGVMSVALKGGMRRKVGQATSLLDNAGTSVTGSIDSDLAGAGLGPLSASDSDDLFVYSGDARQTKVSEQNSTSVMKKGGATASSSNSVSESTTFEYEKFQQINSQQ